MSIKVFIGDDHEVVRKGLRYLIELTPGIDVIGEASTSEESINYIRQLNPDIIILDIAMPKMNGLEAAEKVLHEMPTSKVIILTMHFSLEYIQRAIHIGVSGYILKDSVGEEIIDAIWAVNQGTHYMSAKVADYLWTENHAANNLPIITNCLLKLSHRELEVLKLVAQGKTSNQIAEILFISTKTVETYRSRLMSKLNIDNLANLIKYAIKKGLVSID